MCKVINRTVAQKSCAEDFAVYRSAPKRRQKTLQNHFYRIALCLLVSRQFLAQAAPRFDFSFFFVRSLYLCCGARGNIVHRCACIDLIAPSRHSPVSPKRKHPLRRIEAALPERRRLQPQEARLPNFTDLAGYYKFRRRTQTDGRTDRQTDGQTVRQTDRQPTSRYRAYFI